MVCMTFADLPQPFTRSEASAVGLGRRALDEALRLGQVRRPHRNVYVSVPPTEPGGQPWEVTVGAHLQRLREVLKRLPGHVASHTSAALLHGLTIMISPSSPVEVTAVDRCPRSWNEDGLRVHHSDSHDIPVEEIDGLRVTCLPRTVADTLRTRTLPHGTALLDEVLRHGRLDEREILAALAPMKGWRGRPRALVAVRLSNPVRESWIESYSDVALYQRGVPLPLPQVNIYDIRRQFVGRVDGLDEERGIFREADGEAKYFLGMAAGASAEESALAALAHEQVRHRRLERIGLRGVRWTSSQIMEDPDAVARQVKILRREPVPEITGYAEWEGELRRLPFRVERPDINLEKARTRRPPRRRSRG